MYDMYPWNPADQADDPPGPPRDSASPGGRPPGTPRAQEGFAPPRTPPAPQTAHDAVQVALDRRDSGGDAVAVTGQPSTQPSAGRTRQ